jgi:peptidoglycan/LPS O-acetylase OafA/YrhL
MQHDVKYLSNLTPLRGVAALLVAIFHFEMAIARFIPKMDTMFFEKCYLMVDLFFVMSGFIMLHVYGGVFLAKISRISMRRFFAARFARIYPLYIFSLLLLVILVISFSPPGTYPNAIENPAAIPTNIFLLQSYYIHNIYTWNIPSWSISAETAAYICFPFLALFINRRKDFALILFSIFVAVAYLSIMYLLPRKNPLYPSIPVPHNLNTTYDYGFLRGIAGFIIGIIVYKAYQLPSLKTIFTKDLTVILILLLLILSMHFAINDVYCVILFAVLVLAFACNGGILHLVCNSRLLQFLGNISYSIYMMQIFLQEPFSKGLRLPGVTGIGRGNQNIGFSSGLFYCLIYLLLLVCISSITYFVIERPCRKLINRYWA